MNLSGFDLSNARPPFSISGKAATAFVDPSEPANALSDRTKSKLLATDGDDNGESPTVSTVAAPFIVVCTKREWAQRIDSSTAAFKLN